MQQKTGEFIHDRAIVRTGQAGEQIRKAIRLEEKLQSIQNICKSWNLQMISIKTDQAETNIGIKLANSSPFWTKRHLIIHNAVK